MIDTSGYGQETSTCINNSQQVVSADSTGNTMISIHMYSVAGKDAATVKIRLIPCLQRASASVSVNLATGKTVQMLTRRRLCSSARRKVSVILHGHGTATAALIFLWISQRTGRKQPYRMGRLCLLCRWHWHQRHFTSCILICKNPTVKTVGFNLHPLWRREPKQVYGCLKHISRECKKCNPSCLSVRIVLCKNLCLMIKMIKRVCKVIDICTDFVRRILVTCRLNACIIFCKLHHQLFLTVVDRRFDLRQHCLHIPAIFCKLCKNRLNAHNRIENIRYLYRPPTT